jgi:hypothetical protein
MLFVDSVVFPDCEIDKSTTLFEPRVMKPPSRGDIKRRIREGGGGVDDDIDSLESVSETVEEGEEADARDGCNEKVTSLFSISKFSSAKICKQIPVNKSSLLILNISTPLTSKIIYPKCHKLLKNLLVRLVLFFVF